jgi:hypothetical protein
VSGRLRSAGGRLLAVLCPLVVLGTAWTVLRTVEPWHASDRVVAFNAALAETPPDVVVLGSSYARADTDPDALAEGLGAPGLRTVVLAVPGSSSAVWYAALKGRVVDAGLQPRLVLVVANMGSLMQGAVDDAGQALLAEQLPVGDAALAERAGMLAASDTWGTLFRHRSRLRDPWRERFRGGLVAAIFGDASLAEAASTRVFAAQARDGMEVHARVMPGVGQPAMGATAGAGSVAEAGGMDLAAGLDDPDATFLPHLSALARATGAQFVVALPPTHPSHPAGQRLSPAGEARVLAWARQAGIGWIDLREAPLPPSAYSDGRHMTHEGSVAFSALLGTALRDIDALEGPVRAPEPPAEVTRTGAPEWTAFQPAKSVQDGCLYRLEFPGLPPLSADQLHAAAAPAQSPLRVWSGDEELAPAASRSAVTEGCTGKWTTAGKGLLVSVSAAGAPPPRLTAAGEAVLPAGTLPATAWVYPAGALEWSWRDDLGPGPRVVEVSVTPVGTGAGEIVLTSGSARVPLRESDGTWKGLLPLPEGGPLAVRLEAAPDAPFAWVGSLTVTIGGVPLHAIRAAAPHSVALFATPPTYARAPSAVAQLAMPGKAGMGRFLVDAVDSTGCLRWEVTENGTALPGLVVPRALPFRKSTRTLRHGDSVYYSSEDGTDVARNGRTYALRYRQDRRCGQAQWLLADDKLAATFGPRELRGLLGPPRWVRLAAVSDAELTDDSRVGFTFLRGGETVLAVELGAGALRTGVDLELPAATATGFELPLLLTVQADPHGPDLLLDGTLWDGPPPPE